MVSQKRDVSFSEEGWGADTWKILQSLYARLEERIGTSDVIWCCAEYEYWQQTEVRRLCKLKVPVTDIKYVDSEI